ncbi:MAG: mechanosensitive ion channel [Candidatus Omnitrophica bacterium]|nr:mechanosensitive ion channel [Candidatus Omnitrophota bacterium]
MTKISRRLSCEMLKKTLLPLSIFAVIIALYIGYSIHVRSTLTLEVQRRIKIHFTAVLIISVTFILHRMVQAFTLWYQEHIASHTLSRLDDDFIPLIRRFLKITLWIIAFHTILPLYGVNISALITTLGVASLAIALAAQDTIANIIAGFLIMVDKPFRINDRIKLPSGEMVSVLDIGIRRSRFLADDGSIIIAPNLDLSKSEIVNYTYGEERNINR